MKLTVINYEAREETRIACGFEEVSKTMVPYHCGKTAVAIGERTPLCVEHAEYAASVGQPLLCFKEIVAKNKSGHLLKPILKSIYPKEFLGIIRECRVVNPEDGK